MAKNTDNTLENSISTLEKQVLIKLSLLGEGRSLTYDRPNLHRVHPAATPPPGVNETKPGESHLNQTVSLAQYHAYRLDLARGKSVGARLTALAEAERDYETTIKPPPRYIDPDPDQNSQDRDEAILRWEGKRPEWVAVFENCSESHVRKIRKKHDRDPMMGGKLNLEAA